MKLGCWSWWWWSWDDGRDGGGGCGAGGVRGAGDRGDRSDKNVLTSQQLYVARPLSNEDGSSNHCILTCAHTLNINFLQCET